VLAFHVEHRLVGSEDLSCQLSVQHTQFTGEAHQLELLDKFIAMVESFNIIELIKAIFSSSVVLPNIDEIIQLLVKLDHE